MCKYSLPWQRNGYLSLRDCIKGRSYAWKSCDKRFKYSEEKYKWNNCFREVEKAWKASETTKEKNYSTKIKSNFCHFWLIGVPICDTLKGSSNL